MGCWTYIYMPKNSTSRMEQLEIWWGKKWKQMVERSDWNSISNGCWWYQIRMLKLVKLQEVTWWCWCYLCSKCMQHHLCTSLPNLDMEIWSQKQTWLAMASRVSTWCSKWHCRARRYFLRSESFFRKMLIMKYV